MNLTDLLNWHSGKKTYLTTVVVFVLLFGSWQHWWTIPTEVYGGLLALALAFVRAGVSKASSAGEVPINKILTLLICTAALAGVTGCAPLQPGADPLVVNVERTETIAKSSFDLVLSIDDRSRGFWKTNAPAFHDFCNGLRQPQTVGAYTLPRCYAGILSLDDVKLDYQASRASSNALVSAWSVVTSMLDQSQAWLAIVTTNAPAEVRN